MSTPHLTFFVELPGDRLLALFGDRAVADDLVRGGFAVSIGLMDLSRERAAVIRDLESRQVPVTAWLLLDPADGYWLNADNADHARRRYEETIVWANAEGLRLHRIGLDIEFPRADGDLLFAKPHTAPFTLLRRRRPIEHVRAAEASYAALVAEIRAGGRTVEAYHLPQILDERASGSGLLRRTFGLVDIPVDLEVFMTYSSYLGAAGARIYQPGAAAIALGVTGGGVHAEIPAHQHKVVPWGRFEHELLAASRYSNEIYVFSLEGCVEQRMLPRIVDLDWSKPAADLPAAAMRRAERGRRVLQWLLRSEIWFDRLLPVRGEG